MTTAEALPVILLTGFLGSGKTTLLQRLLREETYADTAVIINELGELGLDRELVTFSEEAVTVLPGGCVCCTIRNDIERTLRDLFEARDGGRIRKFKRIVIETTGIADPLPLLFTLSANPIAATRLTKPVVVTIADGVLGADTIAAQPEALAQVTAADLVLISKRDLGIDARLKAVIEDVNPWATIRSANLLEDDASTLMQLSGNEGRDRQLGRFACDALPDGNLAHGGVRSFCLSLSQPLDWTVFGIWMTMLLHRHGARVLRVKGLLNVEGAGGPVVFHSAQHLVHPPVHLEAWPSDDRRTRLVFILKDIAPEQVQRSLNIFDSAAKLTYSNIKNGGYLPAGAGGTIAGRPVRRATAPRWMKG